MKKLIYLFAALFCVLSSCQDGLGEDPVIIEDADKVTLSYTLDIPDYVLATRSESIANLSLMTFDAQGKFLGKVSNATYTQPDAVSGKGTGSARVSIKTASIHFVANYSWAGYNEADWLDRDEAVVMQSFVTNQQVLWGVAENVNLYATIQVSLLRNYAKIEVIDETEAGSGAQARFGLTGFALANYTSTGTIVTYGEGTGFANVEEVVTVPTTPVYLDQTDSDMDMSPKYAFESNNNSNANSVDIIIKNEAGRYYKLKLIKDNATLESWKVERNYNYKVILKTFEKDPFTNGVGSFDEAKDAASANNLYAEIIKESPQVSDADENRLELEQLVYLFTTGDNFSIQANYYPNGGTSTSNSGIRYDVLEDTHGILSNLGINNGLFTGTVATVTEDQYEATVRISYNGLSREVTIISTKAYQFNPTTPITHNGKDAVVTLNFSIPSDYPAALLPVKCKIHATTLSPVAPNTMLTHYENETYYYIYEANTTGNHSVQFTASFENSSADITIENEYFETGEIRLNNNGTALAFTDLSLSGIYERNEKVATLSFTVPAGSDGKVITIAGLPTEFDGPATYTVSGNNAQTITLTYDLLGYVSTAILTLKADGFANGVVQGNITLDNLRYSKLFYISTSNRITTDNLTIVDADGTDSGFRSIGTSGVAVITNRMGNNNRYYEIKIDEAAQLTDKVTFSYMHVTRSGWWPNYTYTRTTYSKTYTVAELLEMSTDSSNDGSSTIILTNP